MALVAEHGITSSLNGKHHGRGPVSLTTSWHYHPPLSVQTDTPPNRMFLLIL